MIITMKKSKFSQHLDKFVAGKGFYIALFLCVAVIGVTSWAILFTTNHGNEPDNLSSDLMYSSSSGRSSSSHDGKNSSAIDKFDDSSSGKASTSSSDSTAGSDSSEVSNNSTDAAVSSSEPDEPSVNDEPQNSQVSAEDAIYVWPVVGQVLNGHSVDTLVYNITMSDWRTHDGIDIAAEKGATVLAISNGTVSALYDDDLFGTTVVIDHGNGLKSTYSNLAALPTVKIGDSVTVGEVIGSVGNTAIGEINEQSHLHLAVNYNGKSADPLDFLPEQP